jgi:hypothetical protein
MSNRTSPHINAPVRVRGGDPRRQTSFTSGDTTGTTPLRHLCLSLRGLTARHQVRRGSCWSEIAGERVASPSAPVCAAQFQTRRARLPTCQPRQRNGPRDSHLPGPGRL